MERRPTFIGIGATKSGSSWLYANLAEHPGVFAPVKEVRYFTKNSERGSQWYQGLFAGCKPGSITGEFTPSYLYHPSIASSVFSECPDVKLLVILRNPVRRAFSQYKSDYYTGLTSEESFSGYIETNPNTLKQGYYFGYLEQWLKVFPSDRIKIFIFEEAVKDTAEFVSELSDFLNLDPAGFDQSILSSKSNESNAPKFRTIYQLGYKVSQFLRKHGFFFLSKWINRVGSKVFGLLGDSKRKAPPMDDGVYNELIKQYHADITALSEYLGRNENVWK